MSTIPELLARGRTFSVELWPPRSPASAARLDAALEELAPLELSFVSVTYGAGGSTRQRTHDLVSRLQAEAPPIAMAHLTCAAHTRAELASILRRYWEAGVTNILALGGDPPLDSTAPLPPGELAHASDLVRLARATSPFSLAVAVHPEGHPASPDKQSDRVYAARKLGAADFAITQFFFDVSDYLDLVSSLSALGVDKPVVPGIMPIARYSTVAKMAKLSGASIPASLAERLDAVADKPGEVERIGVEVATRLCSQLLAEGAPGLHIFTMNQARATVAIYEGLGIAPGHRVRGG